MYNRNKRCTFSPRLYFFMIYMIKSINIGGGVGWMVGPVQIYLIYVRSVQVFLSKLAETIAKPELNHS